MLPESTHHDLHRRAVRNHGQRRTEARLEGTVFAKMAPQAQGCTVGNGHIMWADLGPGTRGERRGRKGDDDRENKERGRGNGRDECSTVAAVEQPDLRAPLVGVRQSVRFAGACTLPIDQVCDNFLGFVVNEIQSLLLVSLGSGDIHLVSRVPASETGGVEQWQTETSYLPQLSY